jgi:hypothetical protein
VDLLKVRTGAEDWAVRVVTRLVDREAVQILKQKTLHLAKRKMTNASMATLDLNDLERQVSEALPITTRVLNALIGPEASPAPSVGGRVSKPPKASTSQSKRTSNITSTSVHHEVQVYPAIPAQILVSDDSSPEESQDEDDEQEETVAAGAKNTDKNTPSRVVGGTVRSISSLAVAPSTVNTPLQSVAVPPRITSL